jgi:formylmethanofuran dehydrogenase subunit A
LGIEDRVGSLEKGKDGDIAIFNNHPLSIYATPVYTLVDGVIRFDKDKDDGDMRIDIDPNEKFSTYYETEFEAGHEDRCMQDVYEFFQNEK